MGRHFFAICNAEICINTSGVYLLGYWIGYIITQQFVWQCSGNISHFNFVSFLKNIFACLSARAPLATQVQLLRKDTLKRNTYCFWIGVTFLFLRQEGTENVNSKVFLWKMRIVDLHKHKNIDQHLIISISKKALLNQHKAKFTEAQSKRRTFHLPNLIPSNYIKYMKRSTFESIKSNISNLGRRNFDMWSAVFSNIEFLMVCT